MLLSFIKKIKEHFKVNVGCFKILKQLVVYVCVCGKSVKLFYIFSQIVFCVHIHTYICRERERAYFCPSKSSQKPLLQL